MMELAQALVGHWPLWAIIYGLGFFGVIAAGSRR